MKRGTKWTCMISLLTFIFIAITIKYDYLVQIYHANDITIEEAFVEEAIVERLHDHANLINTSSSSCDSVLRDYNISKSNYVLALSYWEQLTMATTNLCGLVNFARGWHSRVVTPFTYNAEMYGLPTTVNFPSITGTPIISYKGPTKPLSLLYDMNQLNYDLFCDQYRLPPLVSFEEFIMNANRQIILLHIDFSNVYPKSSFKGQNYSNCEQYGPIKSVGLKLLKTLNIESERRKLTPFKIGTACCLNHMHVIDTPMVIAEGCGFSRTDNITIIFTVWRGHSDIPTKHFRLVTITSPIFKLPSTSRDIFPLSKDIVNNASVFVNYLSTCNNNNSGEFVAIHLRTAKLAMMGGGRKLFQSCLDKVESVLKELKKRCTSLGTCKESCHKYFIDYGEFGSHSYEVALGKRMSKDILHKKHIEPVHYDPRKYGGKLDQGYVASVEQLAIAHSNVLILVGGGSFQTQMQSRFIQVGRGSMVYRVCETKDEHVQLVYNKTFFY